jgi:hypothetical protein
MKLKANPGALFTLIILLLMVGLVVTAKQWQYQARLFPWTIGIPTMLLCFLQLGMDLFRSKNEDEDVAGMMDLPVDRSVPVAVVIRRAVNIFGWIFGLFLSIAIIGFILSVPLFLLLYLSIQARESWKVSVAYMVVMMVFMIGVFEMVLHIPWPPGLISAPQEFILGLVERHLSSLIPI